MARLGQVFHLQPPDEDLRHAQRGLVGPGRQERLGKEDAGLRHLGDVDRVHGHHRDDGRRHEFPPERGHRAPLADPPRDEAQPDALEPVLEALDERRDVRADRVVGHDEEHDVAAALAQRPGGGRRRVPQVRDGGQHALARLG